MNFFFTVKYESADDLKKLQQLMDAWEGLYSSFEKDKKDPHIIKIIGEKSSLGVVKSNIKKGAWKGKIEIGDIHNQDKVTQEAVPKVVIYLPCITAEAESGRVTLPKNIPKTVEKKLGDVVGSTFDGWKIVHSKASVAFSFDIGNKIDRQKLIAAIDSGWSTWKVCQATKFSTVEPNEIIEPEEMSEQYTEIRAVVGEKNIPNLENIEGIKFKSSSKNIPLPESFIIYDCAARAENPWKIIHVSDSVDTILYDAEKELLNEKKLKLLIKNFIHGD
jgi:hypothetical protein